MEHELPPLPEPETVRGADGGPVLRYEEHRRLMREYARQAVLAERERCARICMERADDGPESMTTEAMLCAAHIRKGA